jgi:hypothetical protein
MANYGIIDTGLAVKPNPINSTPAGSTFNRAYSGNEIVLRSAELSLDVGSNVDNTNVPAKTSSAGDYEGPEINQVSSSADQYTITGIASRKVTADMTMLGYLKTAVKTKGVKLLYYGSTTDGFRDMTDTWGETTTAYSTNGGFTSGTTPVLFVRITKLSVRQTADSSLLRYTLSMIETSQ